VATPLFLFSFKTMLKCKKCGSQPVLKYPFG